MSDAEPPAGEPIEIPYQHLSADALRGVIEAFVLREGTDYGAREFSFEEKVGHVRMQLEHGDALILFDPQSNSIDITSVRHSRG